MDTPYYQHGPARRAQLRDEQHDRDIASLVGCEQILNALTPHHRRNPRSAHEAILRDGYAVYDGPQKDDDTC